MSSEDRRSLNNKDYIRKYIHPIYQPLLVELLKARPVSIEEFMMNWLSQKSGNPIPVSKIHSPNGFPNAEENALENLTKRIDTEDIEYGKDYLGGLMGKVLSFYEIHGDDILKEKKRVSQIGEFIVPIVKDGESMNEKSPNMRDHNEINETGQNSNEEHLQHYSDLSSSESEEEDVVVELPKKLANKNKQRSSVSAEVYGEFNLKVHYTPRVIPKSEAQKEKIMARISQAFMFSGLDDKETHIVIESMEEKSFKQGETVINQGDDGNELYVVESGELDCFKLFSGNEKETYLKTYLPGESFGELALLYNAPRAATIRAKTDATLLALDRECFNHIVKDAACRKREKYDKFLQSVDIFSSMDPYERSKIADAFKTSKFGVGEYVFKQGDSGKEFYLVEHGELVALKVMNEGEEPIEVYNYKENDYFGELSILQTQNRQATIKTLTECQLVSLDQAAFTRLLGPLEDILKRNMDRYSKYM